MRSRFKKVAEEHHTQVLVLFQSKPIPKHGVIHAVSSPAVTKWSVSFIGLGKCRPETADQNNKSRGCKKVLDIVLANFYKVDKVLLMHSNFDLLKKGSRGARRGRGRL